MPAPSTRRISASAPTRSPAAPRCWTPTRPGRKSMLQSPEDRRAVLRLLAFGFAPAALLTLTLPTTPVFAQASGHVQVKILKAGLLVGGGAGTGVLTYRGRSYPFSVSGLSFGITAGATVGRLEGWASGIRDISDF